MIRLVLFLICLTMIKPINAHIDGEHQLGSIGGVSENYLNSSIDILNAVGTYEALTLTSSLPAGAEQERALLYTKQGIALNHAFQWEDAVRSFYEALRLDSSLARAYIGLSQSFTMLNRDSSKLQTVLADLMAKAKKAAVSLQQNEQDRIWIDLMDLFYQQQYGITSTPPISNVSTKVMAAHGANPLSQIGAYIEILINDYNDPEAFAFAGWDLGQVSWLEQGVLLFPLHTGILHYLVHINENTGKYQAAIGYAETMIQVAPEAPHLVHMYGHVLPMVGRWGEANIHFLKSYCIHQAVLRVTSSLCQNVKVSAPMSSYTPAPQEFWHHSHNLELFGFSLMRTRDLQTAESIFSERCQIGDCSSLLQFYLGEKMYEQAIQKITTLKNPSVDFLYMLVQALAVTGEMGQAEALFQKLPVANSLERLAAELALSFAKNSVTVNQQVMLNNLLIQATDNPNFDVWSHILPVLRKLHNYAVVFQAPQTAPIYNAIQKIDPGHPL